jgi:hypothetical protein
MEIDEALSAVDRLVEDWGGERLKDVPKTIRAALAEAQKPSPNKQSAPFLHMGSRSKVVLDYCIRNTRVLVIEAT